MTPANASPAPRELVRLAPAQALTSPLFACALLVLAVNDHLLKGAGLLPSVVTGKLSDVAGLVVAPVVLAVLLRARTKRGFALCQAAALAFLAALKLWPAFERVWSAAFGWRTTLDPTDLLAALILPPAFALLIAAMAPVAPPVRSARARRAGQLLLWPTAAGFLMATGYDPCAEATTRTTEELPLDEPPRYGDDRSGQELLDRVANDEPGEFTYQTYEADYACNSFGERAATTMTVTVTPVTGLATHYVSEVDEAGASEECLESEHEDEVQVSVAVTITFATADGFILVSDEGRLHDWEGITRASINLRDDDAEFEALATVLGLDVERLISIELESTFSQTASSGRVFYQYEDTGGISPVLVCAVGSWGADEP